MASQPPPTPQLVVWLLCVLWDIAGGSPELAHWLPAQGSGQPCFPGHPTGLSCEWIREDVESSSGEARSGQKGETIVSSEKSLTLHTCMLWDVLQSMSWKTRLQRRGQGEIAHEGLPVRSCWGGWLFLQLPLRAVPAEVCLCTSSPVFPIPLSFAGVTPALGSPSSPVYSYSHSFYLPQVFCI